MHVQGLCYIVHTMISVQYVILICFLVSPSHVHVHVKGSLKAYEKASQLLTETVGTDIPPEILNNIGCLHFKLGQYSEAQVHIHNCEIIILSLFYIFSLLSHSLPPSLSLSLSLPPSLSPPSLSPSLSLPPSLSVSL